MPPTSILETLALPRGTILTLDHETRLGLRAPLLLWAELAMVAVFGSLVYGASLTAAAGSRSDLLPAAIRFALAAGLAWLIFIPALTVLLRHPFGVVVHACLVSMAHGEAALLGGAVANVAVAFAGGSGILLVWMNGAVVLAANLVMACSLADQLSALGTRPATTHLLWHGLLNGTGAILFLLLLAGA